MLGLYNVNTNFFRGDNMNYFDLRNELKSFYWHRDEARSKEFAEKCFKILDEKVTEEMSVTEQKILQYDVIANEFQPVVFKNLPFYFETGVLTSLSDGKRGAKVPNASDVHIQAGGWVYQRNAHLFWEQDKDVIKRRQNQGSELLYLICGPFNDDSQHFSVT